MNKPRSTEETNPLRLERVNQIDCLLFDLDGTLVNTTDLIVDGFYQVWERNFGYRPERSVFVKTIGLLLKDAMHQLIEAGVIEKRITLVESHETVVTRLLEEYREHHITFHDQLIQSFAGISETLTELRRRGYRLGVVTSKRREGAERSLRAFDFERLLDVVIAAEDTTEHKPFPAPVVKAMERLVSAPDRTAYIGDSTYDMQAGRRAGVLTIAALWGPFDHSDLSTTEPDFMVTEPTELLAMFPGPERSPTEKSALPLPEFISDH